MKKTNFFNKDWNRLHLVFVCIFMILILSACNKSSFDGLHINTMSFNMKFENQTGGGDPIYSWENRKPGIVKSLSDYDVHILGTQELQTWQNAELLEALGSRWSSVGQPRFTASDENNNIFYRNDLLEYMEGETIWLSETPNVRGSKSWDTAHPRILTYGRFKIKKTSVEFYYYNTHLDHVSALAREKGLELIVSYIEKNSDYPMIFTGDFNMYIDSVDFAAITNRSDTYADTFSLFPERFEVDNRTSHGFQGGTEGKAIDFIFYNIAKWELLNTEIIRDRYQDRFWLSDHYPVYSQFKVIS